MTERRFLPLLLTHALGIFDATLLIALLIRPATGLHAAAWSRLSPPLFACVAGALFLLPCVAFCGIAGQLAEAYDRARVVTGIEALAIGLSWLAISGLERHTMAGSLAVFSLVGLHCTLLAPAKYALVPQVLDPDELVGGNALLATGTFLAILSAAGVAGLPAARATAAGHGTGSLTTVVPAVAVAAFLVSLAIPAARAPLPHARTDWHPLAALRRNLEAARRSRAVLLSLLGVSWFYFYGVLVLLLLPPYCDQMLHGSGSVVTLTVVVFSLGVGAGALLCERLSGGRLDIGLVPFGSFGLTLFSLDWIWGTPALAPGRAVDAAALMALPGGWRVLLDLAALGACGGLFVGPLNVLVQQRGGPDPPPRLIGAGSLSNALGMVAAAVLGAIGLAHGLRVWQLIFAAALANAVIALYIYHLLPEFLLRFVCYVLVHILYRLRRAAAEPFPESGAALLVSNHVTFVDALVISAACRRPVHFIMDEAIFNAPVIRTVARGMKAIPIASAKDDPVVLEHAFEMTAAALRQGDLVCIFPEGRLTRDGRIGEFRPGLTRILEETPVPVIPMAIVGLWGSMFSKQAPRLWQRLPRKLGARIAVNVGIAVAPRNAAPSELRRRVEALYDTGTG